MQVRDLVNIINTFDVKVVFDEPEQVKRRLETGKHILYFTPVEGKERRKYENLKDKHKFQSTTSSIHIPDVSIKYLMNIYKIDVTGIYEFTKELIEPFCNEKLSEGIVYVTFLFLHEVGHWKQFDTMDSRVEQFVSWDIDATEDNFNRTKALIIQHAERIKKGNACILTAKEKKLFKQYMQEYRGISKEKEADEYAVLNLQTALKLCISYNFVN